MSGTVVGILGSLTGLVAVVTAVRSLLSFQSDRAKAALDEAAVLIAQSRTMREDMRADYERMREEHRSLKARFDRVCDRVQVLIELLRRNGIEPPPEEL